jgi:hypothetical protein
MEIKEIKGLMETYASIYEGYGKDMDKNKKKKKMHDCATHVEHFKYGQGVCIKEQHTMLEDGTVTHYDVKFDKGVVENVSVTELKILASEAHEHFDNYHKNAEVLGESDIFDAILEHLVAEGYADTNQAALAIMANMSEEWKQSIVEEVLDEDSRRMSNKQRTANVRQNIKAFGSNFTPPNNYDPDANRGQGEVLTRKQIEKKRRKELRNPGGEN